MRLTLRELGHPQPPTSIHYNNTKVTGIANSTIKRQRSRSMKIRYFYICDLVKHKDVKENWHPGQENVGDYASKHHDTKHQQHVRPIYLHETNSPRMLAQATKPSVLRGCVELYPEDIYVTTSYS